MLRDQILASPVVEAWRKVVSLFARSVPIGFELSACDCVVGDRRTSAGRPHVDICYEEMGMLYALRLASARSRYSAGRTGSHLLDRGIAVGQCPDGGIVPVLCERSDDHATFQ